MAFICYTASFFFFLASSLSCRLLLPIFVWPFVSFSNFHLGRALQAEIVCFAAFQMSVDARPRLRHLNNVFSLSELAALTNITEVGGVYVCMPACLSVFLSSHPSVHLSMFEERLYFGSTLSVGNHGLCCLHRARLLTCIFLVYSWLSQC